MQCVTLLLILVHTGLKGTLFALVSNWNTLYNVMGVKTHLSVNLPQSVSISGAEINLTLRAVTTYVLCCNLAPSMSALKMCIFSTIVMKWYDFCCGLGILYKLCGSANNWSKGFIFSGKIWWQLFSWNKTCWKYHTRSTTTPKYTLPQRLVRIISKTPFDAYTNPIFKSLRILKFSDIYFFQVGKCIYSFKIGLLPNVFKEIFLITNQVHSYNTGNSNTFHLFPARTKTFWNKISGS